MKYSFQTFIAKVIKKIAKSLGLTDLYEALQLFFSENSDAKIKEKIRLAQRLQEPGALKDLLHEASKSDQTWLDMKQAGVLWKQLNQQIPLSELAQSWPGLHFSQEGEDRFLERLFAEKSEGIYVEIGGHHPLRFSNTASFYLKGWKGVIIEPDERNLRPFQTIRPRDTFVNKAIGKERASRTFYLMEEGALNSFDKPYIDWLVQDQGYKLWKSVEMEVCPLRDLVSELPLLHQVDFLSIDVEGLEMDVLQSNDWQKLKPTVIVVEILNCQLSDLSKSEVHQFLINKNYEAIGKTVNSVFYKLRS